MKILAVDDEAFALEVLVRQLRSRGCVRPAPPASSAADGMRQTAR